MQKQFVHLHTHSSYSILDGMSSIEGLIDKAIEDGMTSLALTDHGNMFGIKKFHDYANKKNYGIKNQIKQQQELANITVDAQQKENIKKNITSLQQELFKPIFGCEVYVARRTRFDKTEREDRSGYHLVVLAKNKKGYQNLCKLVSYGYIDGFYYKPRIDHELLEKYSEGLIVASACLGGEIHKKIESGDLQAAENAVLWHKKVFGEDYYIELQRHKTDKKDANTETFIKQEIQNKELIRLAQKTNTKLIATNDVHFIREEHADAHEHLICLSTGKKLNDETRMRYTKQEWLKSPEEMWEIFKDIPEALTNTVEIANKIEHISLASPPIMPKFEIPADFGTEEEYKKRYDQQALIDEFGEKDFKRMGGYDKVIRIKLEADFLTKITYEGAKKRYGEKLNEETIERLEFELDVMKKMGFPGYFLIVQDFINAAREMDIAVGPGRGSAAGSAVAYCLKITNIDPLKYDLLFERFLNPDRISLPDIDIDFEDDKRGQIVRWVTEKYGKERVASIVTYGTMATKSALKDVARVQELPLSEADRLTKLIPTKFPQEKDGKNIKVNIPNCIKYIDELQQASMSADSKTQNTLKYAAMLEGTVRQTGVHACGLIIGADDLIDVVPLSTATDKETQEEKVITQFEGKVIEDVGLVKMDFLGLKTLSIIKDTIAIIKKTKGIDLDIDQISYTDKKTYQLFSKGDTTAVFQFESAGMQKYLKELKPTRFEDLIAMNALYRPGPMDYIPEFIKRKHGEVPIVYDLPVMEKRLKETYGITVYQEQVMLQSRDIANFTRGESDGLRKAMGKKLKDDMEKLHIKFIDGATKNGFQPKEKLEKIWKDWAKFAEYAFNKSHATCYAQVAYQTAYLKAHYPSEFMAANLNRNKDNITEISKLMDECKTMKINILGPNVNASDISFSVDDNNDIRFGLGGIKNVGEGAAQAIVDERNDKGKFDSITNFVERVDLSTCNKKSIESLAYAGAFDDFEDIKREQFFATNSKDELVIESLIKYGNLYQLDKIKTQNSLFGNLQDNISISKPEIPNTATWTSLSRLNHEREMIGIYLSAHPMDEYQFELKNLCNSTTETIKDLSKFNIGKGFKIGGIVTGFRTGTTKTGRPYGMITIEDYRGAHEFPLFGQNFEKYGIYMIKDLFLYVHTILSVRGSEYKRKENNEPPVIELKIAEMIPLRDLRKRIKRIRIKCYLQRITIDLIEEFQLALKNNKGNISLHFDIVDINTLEQVSLYSRTQLIGITKKFYEFLLEKEKENILNYKIETK